MATLDEVAKTKTIGRLRRSRRAHRDIGGLGDVGRRPVVRLSGTSAGGDNAAARTPQTIRYESCHRFRQLDADEASINVDNRQST